MNNPLILANELTCCRGERLVVNNICFKLHVGEVLQITGANGSGKTTLLRALTGLYPLEKGHINWCGKSINSDREAYYRQMYYLGHTLGVKGELTVAENLRFNWREDISAEKSVDKLLAQLGLAGYENVLCRQLSRGQRQRLALAQLLATKAVLWILDEPFAALDQLAATLLQQIFIEKLAAGGCIIFTSHQPLTLAQLSPQILALPTHE